MNKNTRITPVTPPAGFTTETETTPRGEEFFYCAGPKATSGQITVESFWDQPGGISFHITNDRHMDNGIFNREELEAIPGMIKSVLETIDLAHTEQYLAERPELLDNIKTVTDLARIADEHNLKVTGVFAVYEVRYKAELDAARINRQDGANNA
ncbi:hypothetical protein ACLQ8T_10420 [Glutamicibacter sp. FR1]|uniref:hypothetical protein n=1 Tax=Glutamicibacter sp. FR1 TaxID=3393744 RepID=UPI0039AF3E7E